MKKLLLSILMLTLSLSLISCNEEKNGNKEVNQEQKQLEISQKINDEMKDEIEKISEKVKNGKMTNEEAEKAMIDSMNNSETVKTQLEISKEQTPKMIKWAKANMKCLEGADNKSDAEKCMKKSNDLAKKLGLDDFYMEKDDEDFDWNESEKKEILIEMSDAINEMEWMLPCIEKAEVITDLMECRMGE